jgi:hypothetical protein
MAVKRKVASNWESRHLGNCFIHRTSAGWVVSLLHSEGVTGPSDFLVPFDALDRRHGHPLAARLRSMLRRIVTELGDVRRVPEREAAELMQRPHLGPLWRGRTRWYPPGPGNWNGRGKLCPTRRESGLSYFALRTDQGWLVLLRSIWGNPCGSYLVPLDKVPFRGRKWDADFFLRPLRYFISHRRGARKLDAAEMERLLRWDTDPETMENAA